VLSECDDHSPMLPAGARQSSSPFFSGPALTALAWVGLLVTGCVLGTVMTDAHPGFDARIVRDLRGAPHTSLTSLMRAMTWLGSPLVLNVVFAAGLIALLLTRSWWNVLFLILASPGTVLMVQIIKSAVDRTRPLGAHLTHAAGPSWPSGHASSSAALYGGLLLIALSMRPESGRRGPRTAAILVAALLGLIGLSRVYLGVHYLTDVAAAWLLAGAWLAVLERTVGHGPPSSGASPLSPSDPQAPGR
jgi:undecaprenyl-diphosphatase